MTTNAVVEHFDVLEHVGSRLVAGFVANAVHALILQTVEEALARRVDAPMSRSSCGVSQIREDQRIQFAHDIAFQTALNLFR